ncbi:MAG: helix-turn-helix transcriptional regulator [Bacteroidota bacterium]
MKLLLRSEELVLLAVWHLGDNAYGVTVRRYLMAETSQHFSFASVYDPLDRLTRQGFLKATDGAPTKERGGRRRRFFTLTDKGLTALAEVQRINAVLWQGVPQLASRL